MIGSKLNTREKLLPTFNVGDLLRVSRNYSPARLLASPDVAAEKIAEVSMNSLLIVVEAPEAHSAAVVQLLAELAARGVEIDRAGAIG